MVELRVELLGPLRVVVDGTAVAVPGTNLQRLVLRLALASGRAVSNQDLVDAVWSDDLPAHPRAALQTLVSRARRVLGAGAQVLRQSGSGYRLEVSSTDDAELAALLTRARAALAAGHPDAATRACADARALQRGVPLGDLADLDWARTDAIRLAHLCDELDAVDAEVSLAAGEPALVITFLTPRVAADPDREDLVELLARAYAAGGRPADALGVIEVTRRHLRDTLGTDLSPALAELHLDLLRGDGEAAPTPRQPRRTTLPVALTSFVGRERELAAIERALTTGRLVTLVGPGGAGKTRTSVEVARSAAARGLAIGVVELAAAADAEHITDALLRDLGIGRPTQNTTSLDTRTDSWDRLVEALRSAPFLLVVDNCEHLIDGAASTVENLLTACSQLCVLATSREPLAIDGEAVMSLGSLDLPAADATRIEAESCEAVLLFVDRAGSAQPGFAFDDDSRADVIHLVRALDGLPLALELAAARLRVMPLRDLCAGLKDRFATLVGGSRTKAPRHRTLRALIEWSWDLLAPDERLLLERLSVFSTGASACSAAHVCGGYGVDRRSVPQLLAALVDKSLLVVADGSSHTPTRYVQLESIREYGRERLSSTGELARVQQRFARHLGRLTHQLTHALIGPNQGKVVRRIDAEAGNSTAALSWLIAHGDVARARRLTIDLTQIAMVTGRLDRMSESPLDVLALGGDHDASWWLLRAIAIAVDDEGELGQAGPGPSPKLTEVIDGLLAHLDAGAGMALAAALLLHLSGSAAEGDEVIERALAGDSGRWRGMFLTVRAAFAENRADLVQVRRDVDSVLGLDERVDEWTRSSALGLRATLRIGDGHLEEALGDLDAAMAGLGDLPNSDDRAPLLARQVHVLVALGRTAEARALLETRMPAHAPNWFAGLGTAIALTGRLEIAVAENDQEALDQARDGLHGYLDHLSESRGPGRTQVLCSMCAPLAVAWIRDDPGRAQSIARTAVRDALTTQDRPILALTVAALAVTAGVDDLSAAAELLGLSEQVRGLPDDTVLGVADLRRRLREGLGVEGAESAVARGRDLDADAALNLLRTAVRAGEDEPGEVGDRGRPRAGYGLGATGWS